ncbi:hypothetical protein ACQP2U_43580 (plasmid) [Nocardia sp. CA-084685]|uniref:hypothetical protein n=1 Tax=Nocardia sp. CA-084685 TaxID=3239970 RepID=UPI003D966687
MDRDAVIEQLTAKFPSAEEFLAGWSTHGPGTPGPVQGVARFTFEVFDDPRLLLVLGVGWAGSRRVAWCLWGSASNGPDPDIEVPVAIPATLSDSARRALQLLAVDQDETEEAAAFELADIEVAHQVAELAMSVAGRTPENDYTAADFGATVHAVLPGTGDVDVICVGTPMWIGT